MFTENIIQENAQNIKSLMSGRAFISELLFGMSGELEG